MYEVANEKITGPGLSLGARLMLGSVTALFCLMMAVSAPESKFPLATYGIAGFFLCISLACFTWGRVRQFIGSIVGTAIVCISFWYLWAEVTGGLFISGRRSEPSVVNAIFFFACFGVPSAVYVFKARFGFGKKHP